MAQAEADDLADIFFGARVQQAAAAPAGRMSQHDCDVDPCDIRDICDKQATTRVAGPFQGLRQAATNCDIDHPAGGMSQNVASCRKGQNSPEGEQRRGLSQKSQMSQGVESQTVPMLNATTTEPNTAAPDPAGAWTEQGIARFTARRNRLMRWGWTEADAEALAARLVQRDREADERVSCAECAHYRPGRCGNHGHAGLQAPDVGRTLAVLLQRCPGFKSQERAR